MWLYLQCLTWTFRANFPTEIHIVLPLLASSCERMIRTEIIPQYIASSIIFDSIRTTAQDLYSTAAATFITFSLNK